jgi:hypothetical protein
MVELHPDYFGEGVPMGPYAGDENLSLIPYKRFGFRYVASKDGTIYSLRRNGVDGFWPMVPQVKRTGYASVCLSRPKEGNRPETFRIHRLVLVAFKGDPGPTMEVDHRNGDKLDNRLDNLEWVTPSVNNLRARKNGLNKGSERFRTRPVEAVHLSTGEVRRFYSMNSATQHGFKTGAICLCCQGKQASHHGYAWKYLDLQPEQVHAGA